MSGQAATDRIIVTQQDSIATLVINNPAKRNALYIDLLVDFMEALAALEKKDVRVLVIRGAGEKSFCSGFDISAIPTRMPSSEFKEKAPRNVVQEAIGALARFPVPTIAMVNGHAYGAGCELITACDLRVAVEEATFGMPPARLGIIYSPVGLTRFLNLIGVAATKEMFFTALPVDAPRALAIGLVNHVVARTDLQETVAEMARSIAANAPLAVRGMKRVINACIEERPLSAAMEEEAFHLVAESFASEDMAEGQAAFLEGRKPRFKGR